MNPIKEWIESIAHISRENAEHSEFHQKVQERLFIFAIEIGRRKRLTPRERQLYEKTLATAQVLIGVTEKSVSNLAASIPFDRIADECLEKWIEKEPKLKSTLEKMLGHRFEELDEPPGMLPETRKMIAEQLKLLSRLFPDQLSATEIGSILDRLEHPLDRA